MKGKIIYSINAIDVQNVAFQELNRFLTDDEVTIIKNNIAEKIDWYEAISSTINCELKIYEENIKHQFCIPNK